MSSNTAAQTLHRSLIFCTLVLASLLSMPGHAQQTSRVAGETNVNNNTPYPVLVRDEEFIFDDELFYLDLDAYLEAKHPRLEHSRFYVGGHSVTLGEAIRSTAFYNMINPQVLLALTEIRTSFLTSPAIDSRHIDNPFGLATIEGFIDQLDVVASELHRDYYDHRYEPDRYGITTTAQEVNSGSYAVFRFLLRGAEHTSAHQITENWRRIFDEVAAETLQYQQPRPARTETYRLEPLQLPWEESSSGQWRYTQDPHNWDGTAGRQPLSSLDFGVPQVDSNRCRESSAGMEEWVVAATGGTVVRAGMTVDGYGGHVVIDHGGGFQTHYLHLAEKDLIGEGGWAEQGTRLGHPFCYPNYGYAYPHLHFAVSVTSPAQPPWGWIPMANTILSGWRVNPNQNSDLTRLGNRVTLGNNIDISLPRFAPVILYSDANYLSHPIAFYVTGIESFDLPLWIDNYGSSLKVPAGWAAVVYEEAGTGGASRLFLSSFQDFWGEVFTDGGSNIPLNDNVSSIKISLNYCPAFYAVAAMAPGSTSDVCEPLQYNDDATFQKDITIPDNFLVSPRQPLVKTWRFRNTGDTTWGSGYQLVFVSGEQMGGPTSVNVPAAAPGQEVDISVGLTAPEQAGDHTGYWRLRNPQGTFFGPTVWVKIHVSTSNPGSHITQFDITPASPSEATSVHIVGRARYFTDFRSMRFVIGNEAHEMTNFRQIGDQMEISAAWNTASLPRGDYAVVFEVAKNGDPDWASAERQVRTYTLIGTPQSTNRPPDRPLPESPYNWYLKDASGAAAPVRMCVYPSNDPDGDPVYYYFEAHSDQTGTHNSGWLSSRCWEPTLQPGLYQWKAKTGDGEAASDWSSDPWHFSVAAGGVYIGEIQFYQKNTNETHMCVQVTYDGIQGPEVYAYLNHATDGSSSGEWRLLDHYGPNAPPDCTQSNYHGFWIRSPFYASGNHLIRINAIKRDSGASDTADTYYNIAYIRPHEPTLLAPSSQHNNGTWWHTRTIHFEWSPALRADNYTLRVSTQSNPWGDASPILHLTFGSGTTSYDHTLAQDYSRLYWSVRASNSQGSADSGPNVWFGIDTVDPTCAVEALPAATYENVFQAAWAGTDGAAGIRSYNVQYRDSDRPNAPWHDWVLNQGAERPYELFTGQPGHTYYFRCQATDRASNTGSYPDEPDTHIKVDPAARPPTPWWDSGYSHKRNLTILNNMANVNVPAGYPVHLHFDNGTTPTAEELYNASQAASKCDDLRIVHIDTSEVHRSVTKCTDDAVDVWFRSQVAIASGSSELGAHQLYIGNPDPGLPPTDPNEIWYPFKESGTVYLYFFQEGSGATAYDSSGNGRHCSIDPSVQWSGAKFGHGLELDRANNSNSRSLQCGTAIPLSSFTVEFWYRADRQHDVGRIAGQVRPFDNPGPGNWIIDDDGRLSLSVWPCPTCASSTARSNFDLRAPQYFGAWVHVAITFNGDREVRFYLNGTLDSVTTLDQSGINTELTPFEIGSAQGIAQIEAGLGAFRISNGVKTSFPYGRYGTVLVEPTVAVGQALTPPEAGAPDLTILEVTTYPNPAGGLIVQATVQNVGELETLNGFFTDLYIDHLPTGTGDYIGSLQFWVNQPVAAGAVVQLRTAIPDVAQAARMSSEVLAPSSEVNMTLYAQTDSAGAVPESDDGNNILSDGVAACIAAADVYEDDNTRELAGALLLNTPQTHNIHLPADEDWFEIQAAVDTDYLIRTAGLGPAADTYLYLYEVDGSTLLASNDDYNGTLASAIKWKAPTSGTYYVRVAHWNPNLGGCGTTYDVLFTDQAVSSGAKLFIPLLFKDFSSAQSEPQSISLPIVNNEMDGYEDPAFHISGDGLNNNWIGTDTSVITGLVFADAGIPRGATILNAYLSLRGFGTEGSSTARIRAFAQDNAPGFLSDGSNRPSMRPVTQGYVDWNNDWPFAWQTFISPDISSVVQEVVNRPGWIAHNNIGVQLSNPAGSGTNWCVTDFASGSLSAGGGHDVHLDVTYLPP
jgi:hypothetical protein